MSLPGPGYAIEREENNYPELPISADTLKLIYFFKSVPLFASINGNTAFAHYSAVLGGKNNFAGDIFLTDHTIGDASSVTGGWVNTASGECASVSGGVSREATGGTDWVGGSLWENY